MSDRFYPYVPQPMMPEDDEASELNVILHSARRIAVPIAVPTDLYKDIIDGSRAYDALRDVISFGQTITSQAVTTDIWNLLESMSAARELWRGFGMSGEKLLTPAGQSEPTARYPISLGVARDSTTTGAGVSYGAGGSFGVNDSLLFKLFPGRYVVKVRGRAARLLKAPDLATRHAATTYFPYPVFRPFVSVFKSAAFTRGTAAALHHFNLSGKNWTNWLFPQKLLNPTSLPHFLRILTQKWIDRPLTGPLGTDYSDNVFTSTGLPNIGDIGDAGWGVVAPGTTLTNAQCSAETMARLESATELWDYKPANYYKSSVTTQFASVEPSDVVEDGWVVDTTNYPYLQVGLVDLAGASGVMTTALLQNLTGPVYSVITDITGTDGSPAGWSYLEGLLPPGPSVTPTATSDLVFSLDVSIKPLLDDTGPLTNAVASSGPHFVYPSLCAGTPVMSLGPAGGHTLLPCPVAPRALCAPAPGPVCGASCMDGSVNVQRPVPLVQATPRPAPPRCPPRK